ncbi:MAG: hypothetical protein L0Y61_07050, partial [Epsilonproteobacteria bacterium]|nr:hypothetical protein [Campylobacterota bacterium]
TNPMKLIVNPRYKQVYAIVDSMVAATKNAGVIYSKVSFSCGRKALALISSLYVVRLECMIQSVKLNDAQTAAANSFLAEVRAEKLLLSNGSGGLLLQDISKLKEEQIVPINSYLQQIKTKQQLAARIGFFGKNTDQQNDPCVGWVKRV